MQRRRVAIPVVALALAAVGLSAVPASATATTAGTQQIVVGMRPGIGHSVAIRAAGATGRTPTALPANRYVLHVPNDQVAATLAALRAQAGVAYVEVPKLLHAAVAPNDPCLVGCGPLGVSNYGGGAVPVSQGDLTAIGAPAAWAITKGSASVTVGVLDGPVLTTHPDLVGKVTQGPDICAQDDSLCLPGAPLPAGDPVDPGHGTHVTGTIAASTNNGQGVASLGWNTTARTYQVLDNTGSGNTVDLATGIIDATNDGDRVLNLSVAGPTCAQDPVNCGPDPDSAAAVRYAEAHNVVVVAAAGNAGTGAPTYPASYPGVLSVGATDNAGAVAGFSETGSAVNIAAPGVDVVSTWDDGEYATLSGTSMASPHVAAAAALMIAANPALSAQQVTDILEATASTTSGPSIGGGLLDAASAVANARAGLVPAPRGYELAGSDGSTYAFGASFYAASVANLAKPVVGAAVTPDRQGEWLVASDGGVFAFGDAAFYGSTGGVPLNRPIVGMAATPDGGGYWLVASDGGVFAFGDAKFYGSTGGIQLARPVVGITGTASGGYWLVASDGGIFSYGPGASFYGSTGGVRLTQPVVGMAATGSGGYWLVASDGGIFSYGPGAAFYGSLGGVPLPGPIVAINQP